MHRDGGDWESSQRIVNYFSTVEEFWRVYENLTDVSSMKNYDMFHYFKVFCCVVLLGLEGY